MICSVSVNLGFYQPNQRK